MFNLKGEHVLFSFKEESIRSNRIKAVPFYLWTVGGTYGFIKKALSLSVSEKIASDSLKCMLWFTFGMVIPISIIRNIKKFANGLGQIRIVYEMTLKNDGEHVFVRCLGGQEFELPIRSIFVKSRFMLDKTAYNPVRNNQKYILK